MSRRRTLPLGIDIGTERTRVALLEGDSSGAHRLVAVATRPAGGDAAATLADAWRELRTRERRCVLAVQAPHSELAVVRFPAMPPRELQRAARFETMRRGWDGGTTLVSTAATDDGGHVVAAARRSVIEARVDAARRAKLRPLAVDEGACALLRAFPRADAVLDLGALGTRLAVRDGHVPAIRCFEAGGGALTAAVAAALGLDDAAAERRKCTLGLAGAGEHVRDGLVSQIASTLAHLRSGVRIHAGSVSLTGNGSRLAGFADALELALAIPVREGTLAPADSVVAADVLRSASPDWALAFGLALWECAA